MGVMGCGRMDCEHIMCDRLILDGRTYICPYCWQELLAHKATWPPLMPLAEVRARIETFMETKPGTYLPAVLRPEEVDREFERLTGRSQEEESDG